MQIKTIANLCLLYFAAIAPLQGAITFIDGRVVDVRLVATMSAQEHYNAGVAAWEEGNWSEAERQFAIVTANFPCTKETHEASFYLGVACYTLEEYDFANDAFTEYLKAKQHPKFFIEAIEYKFSIAEQFRCGARRRILGTKQLPKWANGYSEALDIYDEIINALPCHEMAVYALFSKGQLQWSQQNYKESIDAFRVITQRFPKHELAPESYLAMMSVYLEQSRTEFQNPDILAFAEITLRRFSQNFPREERLQSAEDCFLAIKEIYAKGFFDTGVFYEKIDKPVAASIYYQNAVNLFPETQVALWCQSHLARLSDAGVAIILPAKDSSTAGQNFVLDENEALEEKEELEDFPLIDLDDE